MMGRRVILGEVITKVVTARISVEFELALFYLVFYPIEMHVNCSRAWLFSCTVDDAVGSRVIVLRGLDSYVLPIYLSVIQRFAASLALSNKAPISASEAE